MIFRRRNSGKEDKGDIAKLAKAAGLNFKVAEILWGRGIKTEAEIKEFLRFDIEKMFDPLKMKGMTAAVERIEAAIEAGERIAVYGDYDTDGICSAAILTLYLVGRGVEVYPFIPNRVSDGYGLNKDSLEKLIECGDVSLVITCDCGIGGCEEVAHCADLGVDVIVTDHHEIGGELPDCIVIDNKQGDCAYPFKQLCGAGVALKVVEALGGREEAAKYMYLAAIATVADLVPLVCENRLIVQLGLKQLQNCPNKGLARLADKLGLDKILTAGDIAYKISPHINAAGRMGDAFRAFELITDADPTRADAIIDEIIRDNTARKTACEVMYNEAVAAVKEKRLALNPALVLSNPKWERGITGIVAARLSGEFCRPVFILVDTGGGCLKGTARSFANVNIHALLSDAGDILEEFGGHSAAAGFSIMENNLAEFEKRIYTALADEKDLFAPCYEYDAEISAGELNLELATALQDLEPFGNGNPRPLFLVNEREVGTAANGAHMTVILSGGTKAMLFGGARFAETLKGGQPKAFLTELSVNVYNGKAYPRAVIKDVWVGCLEVDEKRARAAFLYSGAFKSFETNIFDEKLLSKKKGVLIICGSADTYNKFNQKYGKDIVLHEFLHSRTLGNPTKVMVSPVFDFDLSGYEDIIHLDEVPYDKVALTREIMAEVFRIVRKMPSGTPVFDYYDSLTKPAFDIEQWGAGLAVLAQIGVLTIEMPYNITVNSGVKADLNESALFKRLGK